MSSARTIRTSVSLTPDEWRRLRALAAAAGMEPLQYILARAAGPDADAGQRAPGATAYAQLLAGVERLESIVPAAPPPPGITPREVLNFLWLEQRTTTQRSVAAGPSDAGGA